MRARGLIAMDQAARLLTMSNALSQVSTSAVAFHSNVSRPRHRPHSRRASCHTRPRFPLLPDSSLLRVSRIVRFHLLVRASNTYSLSRT